MSKPGPGELVLVPAPPLASPAVPRRRVSVSALEGVTGGGDAGEPGALAPEAGPSEEGEPDVIAAGRQLPHPHLLWVQEHLHHLSASAQSVSAPALRLAEIRQRPWWR
jgi:hypothetical protein